MLAVIGTAGQANAARITPALYEAMYAELQATMREWGVATLVSGGAAVADHLAVRAFLEGEAGGLRLYLPAAFDRRRFVPLPGSRPQTAETANALHADFSRRCGIDSLAQIAEAVAAGAEVVEGRAFLARNMEVARVATHMLALTFGGGREPLLVGPEHPGFTSPGEAGLRVHGGTAHTWSHAWRCVAKRHVPLGWLENQLAAPAPAGGLRPG